MMNPKKNIKMVAYNLYSIYLKVIYLILSAAFIVNYFRSSNQLQFTTVMESYNNLGRKCLKMFNLFFEY